MLSWVLIFCTFLVSSVHLLDQYTCIDSITEMMFSFGFSLFSFRCHASIYRIDLESFEVEGEFHIFRNKSVFEHCWDNNCLLTLQSELHLLSLQRRNRLFRSIYLCNNGYLFIGLWNYIVWNYHNIEKAMKTHYSGGVFIRLSNNILFQEIFLTHSSVCNSLWALRKW